MEQNGGLTTLYVEGSCNKYSPEKLGRGDKVFLPRLAAKRERKIME